ncbi:Male germ-cell putative homeodomain transcription factor [Nesidiocoris tenuis]|uniref:Male germ-cell putative homeodomain transcription factor n=1 Tax=Nesidiocoris tenuis TaxID=355587 RepID=A0ABN7AJC6_9HEMI|nr:Male germ-cell putative homeodomain transcription factor [Nesidiocoris tenuis]
MPNYLCSQLWEKYCSFGRKRGSSFTKAKPKHGIMTVIRLGCMRLLFLPFYRKWWCHQTSAKLFLGLLLLYILQVSNVCIFIYVSYCVAYSGGDQPGVSGSEVGIPAGMMILLSILHSQIVSPRYSGAKDLAPFSTSSRRKRTKRRLTRTIEKPISDGCSSVATPTELNAKFPKRVRSRKLSFEDGCKNSSRRNSLTCGVHEKRLSLIPHVSDDDIPEPDGDPVEANAQADQDDGFESLNSQGSSEDSKGDSGDFPAAGPQADDDEIGEATDPELVPVANQRASPEAVFRNNWLEQSARRASLGVARMNFEESDHKDSDSDNSSKVSEPLTPTPAQPKLLTRRRGSQQALHLPVNGGSGAAPIRGGESSYNSSDDGETTGSFCPALTEGTTSAAEWIGITTNSDDCSVSSEIDEQPFASEFYSSPTAILSPSCAASDKVSCTMWEKREVKKADLSVLDISSAIIARVEAMPEHMDYFYAGMFVSVLLGLVPSICRIVEAEFLPPLPGIADLGDTTVLSPFLTDIIKAALGNSKWVIAVSVIALIERTAMAALFFFLVTVAERTFKQRFLYAKFFSHLTSFRRARKSELPHFRLNKVRNIKTWLSVRSYLRKRGPQHSVDVIVSTVFLITIILLTYLAIEHIKDSDKSEYQCNVEALVWSIILGLFLLRFMTLGTKINRKYRNLSVLITEQINLYLQIEQKPNKKEELMVANSVLKLAADLLKELESPYKISGLAANPYLFTITKVVILSALSGVLSELLGFKLKLHKIKIK